MTRKLNLILHRKIKRRLKDEFFNNFLCESKAIAINIPKAKIGNLFETV
jgi:hypothetical protein